MKQLTLIPALTAAFDATFHTCGLRGDLGMCRRERDALNHRDGNPCDSQVLQFLDYNIKFPSHFESVVNAALLCKKKAAALKAATVGSIARDAIKGRVFLVHALIQWRRPKSGWEALVELAVWNVDFRCSRNVCDSTC